ncbi:MAG: N-acetylmuramoyl-L-alanine amidase [Sarcina sp.]
MVDVVLDASHGGDDTGILGLLGTKEKECTLYIAKACRNILEGKGFSVKLTRENDEWVEGEERSKIANLSNAKCFVSIHLNSSDDRRESGVEVVSSNTDKEVSKLSFNLLSSLSKSTKLNSRGTKYSDLILFKEITIPAAIVKVCFLTNPREEKLLLDQSFNLDVAGLIANGIEKYICSENNSIEGENLVENLKEKEKEKVDNTEIKMQIETLTPIIGGEIPEKNQAKQWAKNKKCSEEVIKLVDLYWNLYVKKDGVNPAIAYSQALIETDKASLIMDDIKNYFNPGGLKEDKSEKYKKFTSWKEGVEAHLDHLALYAGAKGYPNKESLDPRHFSYLFGVCKNVENLSGKWSSDPDYGINILKYYYEILETQTKDIFRESIESIDGLKTQISEFKSKVVLMGRTLEEVCKEYNQIYKSLEVLKDEIVTLEVDKQTLESKNVELNKNVEDQKKVLKDIMKIIGGTVEQK